jgi:hypothetical protein
MLQETQLIHGVTATSNTVHQALGLSSPASTCEAVLPCRSTAATGDTASATAAAAAACPTGVLGRSDDSRLCCCREGLSQPVEITAANPPLSDTAASPVIELHMFAFDSSPATAAAAAQAAAADGAKLLLRGVTFIDSSASAPAASPVNMRLPSWLSAKQLMGLLETCVRDRG